MSCLFSLLHSVILICNNALPTKLASLIQEWSSIIDVYTQEVTSKHASICTIVITWVSSRPTWVTLYFLCTFTLAQRYLNFAGCLTHLFFEVYQECWCWIKRHYNAVLRFFNSRYKSFPCGSRNYNPQIYIPIYLMHSVILSTYMISGHKWSMAQNAQILRK